MANSAGGTDAATPVRFEEKGRAILLTIDRPQKRNALDGPTRNSLRAALDRAGVVADACVVVLTGTGKSFAAGADIAEMAGRSEAEQRAFIAPPTVYDAVQDCPLPVVAAVNGFALGAGCELAMACDLRIASTDAKLGQPEGKLGLIPGGGGTQRLTRLVGMGRAAKLVYTGTLLSAEEARAIGLVEEVVPPEKLIPHCLDLAEAMAKCGRESLLAAKRALRAAWELPLAEGLARERELFMLVFGSEEAQWRMKEFAGRGKTEERKGN